MKSKSIFKRMVAFALSTVLALTGVQLPSGNAAAADGDPEAQEAESIALSLPLELLDYQADGMLFQYRLGKTEGFGWTFSEPNGDESLSVLKQRTQLSETMSDELAQALSSMFVRTNSTLGNGEKIVEGLTENALINGALTYKDVTVDMLALLVQNTMNVLKQKETDGFSFIL